MFRSADHYKVSRLHNERAEGISISRVVTLQLRYLLPAHSLSVEYIGTTGAVIRSTYNDRVVSDSRRTEKIAFDGVGATQLARLFPGSPRFRVNVDAPCAVLERGTHHDGSSRDRNEITEQHPARIQRPSQLC